MGKVLREERAVIQQGGCRSISAGSGDTKSPGLVPAKGLAEEEGGQL